MTRATQKSPIASFDSQLLERLCSLVCASGKSVLRANIEEVFTGRHLTYLPQSSVEDVSSAVLKAKISQITWSETSFKQRVAVIRRFTRLLRSESNTMLDLLQAETGKARWHALVEFLEPINTLGYYARKSPALLRDQRRESLMPLISKAVEVRKPKGVVGVIAPWNFPLAIGISDSITALLAGNSVILKPTNQTALSALFAAELLQRSGLPSGVFQVLAGPGETIGQALIEKVDYIAFTGSTSTGIHVAQQAASQLTGCTLELGGKNPMIILEDADLKATVKGVLESCFLHAGQVCMAIEKIFVPEQMIDQFIALLVRAIEDIDFCTTYSYTGAMGSLISHAQCESVSSYIDDAVAHGAQVLVGGKHRIDIGPYYFDPTILTGVTKDMRMHNEEVFGPVAAVYPYTTVAEAIMLANEGDYGLNASIYSKNILRAEKLAKSIRAGTVNINEGLATAYGSMGAPAGGIGKSGLGRRHGSEGLLKYTDAQTVAVQRVGMMTPYKGLSKKHCEVVINKSFGLLNALRIR
ncbi:MAG: succinic semialdehyde dehydrogenase [Mycobacteriaceae bacterium]